MATHTKPLAVPDGAPGSELPALHNRYLQEPADHAPRPYLHPVRSLAGTVVSQARPADHPHHLGLSIAFSDINGTNFWGGSTYTPAGGSMLLDNHGVQRPHGWQSTSNTEFGDVSWISRSGEHLGAEQRRIEYLHHPAPATWSLSLFSVMVPAGDAERLEVSSSAVKGRAGAGYGGIFWRFPEPTGQPLVLSDAGSGADAAHGSLSRWLSISMDLGGAAVTVVLGQDPDRLLPWFIRTEGYLGAGPSVAWTQAAVVDHNNPLKLALHAVIHDGPVSTAAHALELLQQHPLLSNSPPDRTS
ncbi:DUF6807 family protein [Arthrobacter sp. AFG7.2]|uniref:DUF6807 family protein n=1 Tax=Arthrobacter sp. AFG7.2 TaxID=1688693 RepID=UPI0016708958|nr:DUF6807 family protein [Arthrobacter sp. AFG7.2]